MPEFTGSSGKSAVYTAVQNNTCTNTSTDRKEDEVVVTPACPEPVLTERLGIGIVVELYGNPEPNDTKFEPFDC